LRIGKRLTLGWGVLMLGLALFLAQASRNVESTIAEVASILTCLWGVLLVVVMAGIFTRWATARAATWALLLGGLVNLYVHWKIYYGTAPEERVSFVWVGVPGWIVALVIIVVVSLLDPRKNTHLAGLTWSTIRPPANNEPELQPTTRSPS
jgi:Na+/proline symporter